MTSFLTYLIAGLVSLFPIDQESQKSLLQMVRKEALDKIRKGPSKLSRRTQVMTKNTPCYIKNKCSQGKNKK